MLLKEFAMHTVITILYEQTQSMIKHCLCADTQTTQEHWFRKGVVEHCVLPWQQGITILLVMNFNVKVLQYNQSI